MDKERNGPWMSVPQFGDWDQKQGGMPDYSMDFSKIREMRKQNKRDVSRVSLGNEEDFSSQSNNSNSQLHQHPHPDHHHKISPTMLESASFLWKRLDLVAILLERALQAKLRTLRCTLIFQTDLQLKLPEIGCEDSEVEGDRDLEAAHKVVRECLKNSFD